jgi:integrase
MDEVVRWFPLDRLAELRAAVDGRLRSRRRATRRDAIAVALGLHGLRVGEVARALVTELYVPGRVLEVPPFKRCRQRRITLHESLVDVIGRELATRGIGSPYLLCTSTGGRGPRRQFQRMAGRLFEQLLGAGHGLTFHSLRHTFAMHLYRETEDILLVQRMLGHRSLTSTQVYAKSLREIPDACLVRVGGDLDRPSSAPAVRYQGQQLRVCWPEE